MTKDPFKVRVEKPRPKQPLVLTKAEMDRLIINSKCGQDESDEEIARLEELKKRQEATKALSKLVMQRKEPGCELKKRQYEQALHMASKDIEREKRIEVRRNYVLDLAYKRLYEETDRVKYFKQSKNLAEMLNGRDLQLEAKSKMIDLFYQYDKEFILGMLRDTDNYSKEETEKLEKKQRDKMKNAGNWEKQCTEKELKKKREEWEHIRDGYNIREAAQNYEEEMRRAKLERKKKIEKHKLSLDEQRKEKLALLDINAKLDEADEKRAEVFNEAKMDMKVKHKDIKEGLDRQKQMKRQYVADNLKDESLARKVKEEAILQKAVLQADAKHQRECAAKQAKREEDLKEIQEFYEKELEAKYKRKFEDKRRSFQERRRILEKADDQSHAEDTKQQKKRYSERETQHTQLHQIAKKKMDKEAEKMDGVKDFVNHLRSLEREEETFQKYAQIEIAECEARGLDTKPMLVAARPGIECGKGPLYEKRGCIRPRYYSSVAQGDELNHVKRSEKRLDTKSRLGFILH